MSHACIPLRMAFLQCMSRSMPYCGRFATMPPILSVQGMARRSERRFNRRDAKRRLGRSDEESN